MFSSHTEALRDSRGGSGAAATEHQARCSNSSFGGGAARAGLARASPCSRTSAVKGLRRRKAGGRRGGERGVAMEAYRYLDTYHDGISDEDREWNKFEEKDYVELGTSGLMVSRVRACVCAGFFALLWVCFFCLGGGVLCSTAGVVDPG